MRFLFWLLLVVFPAAALVGLVIGLVALVILGPTL